MKKLVLFGTGIIIISISLAGCFDLKRQLTPRNYNNHLMLTVISDNQNIIKLAS